MRRVKARMASTRKGFAIVFLVSLVTSTAIGLAVYNLDNAYIASKFDLVSYVPDRILAGSDASILIMAMDHHGNPMAGKPIEVKLVTGNSTQTLWSGRTDSDGFASPVFKAPSESSKADIVVASGPEEIRTSTVIDDTIRIIITTDKPVYQPGQTMHMRVLSFSGADPLPEQLPLILEVIDPNGDKIFKKQLAPNEFGISSYDLALSDQMIQGTYTIKAYSGERSASKAVIIKDYVLPKFRVELLGMQDWYLIGTQITGIVDAEYFFGEMVQGSVKMNASVYYGVWTSVYKSSGDLALGQYQFSIPPIQYAVGIPEAQGNGYLQINVSVTDTGGHTETRSKVVAIAPQSLAITVLTDSCVTGQYSTFKVIVRTPDGKPVNNTTIFPRLIDVDSLSTNLPPVITDSRGIASVTFLYEGQKTAVFGRSLYSYDNYVSVPLGDGSGVKVITDRPSYSIGDLGKFEIVYSGKSLTSNVYYDVVSRGFVIDRGVAQLSNG
ncbi:MAG: MG2 domain-containing protein, partial [Thermoplasmata archaeon]